MKKQIDNVELMEMAINKKIKGGAEKRDLQEIYFDVIDTINNLDYEITFIDDDTSIIDKLLRKNLEIKIEWSESNEVEAGLYTGIEVLEVLNKLSRLNKEFSNKQGYYKTKLVIIKNDLDSGFRYGFRYDLGSEFKTDVISRVIKVNENILNNDEYLKFAVGAEQGLKVARKEVKSRIADFEKIQRELEEIKNLKKDLL